MRNRLILICLVVCLGLQMTGRRNAWAQPASAPRSAPTPMPEQAADQAADQARQQAEATAARLVEQLGSERFAVRERATEQLIMLGTPALAQLEKASRSESREVRQRSRLVLAVVRELDFHHRIESFERDPAGDKSYGLPGWERYRELVGNSGASRKLFAQMQKAERELLGAELQSADDAAAVFVERCQRLRYSVQIFGTRHELPPIAAALFVATNPNIPLDKSANMSLVNLCQQSAFAGAISSNSHRSILRKLLAAWILREEAVPAHEMLLLALQHSIDQTLPRARAILQQPANVDLYDRHFAVLCLAKFGAIDDVAGLEAVLADETVISRYRLSSLTYTVEMRDVGLAALLTLTKQDAAAFGYPRLRLQEPFVFDTQTLGFVSEEDRQVAIARWRIYRMRPDGQ